MGLKQSIRRAIAHAVAALPPGILHGVEHADIFQRRGYHVTPDHFYQPIPNTDEIDPAIWDSPCELAGVATNIAGQTALLSELLPYIREYQANPLEMRGALGSVDSAILYAVIRKFAPKKIVEIGAGQSTLVTNAALRANGNNSIFTSVDPFPPPYLNGHKVIKSKVERLPLSTFDELDLLFIDSSHVVRIGGDVLYEILDILPRQKIGALIHIHDIFFPHHYPKEWVLKRRTFWTEQYLVQAFLAFNNAFEIIWSATLMASEREQEMKAAFPQIDGDSLWLRRVA